MEFSKISQINAEDENTWKDKIFLTFDIDWAHDGVINDTIDLVEQAGVAATWFITHRTSLLGRLRANENFELGLHPNYNRLLKGEELKARGTMQVLKDINSIVPEAVSVRSHSLTQGTVLQGDFQSLGITHESNILIPEQANFGPLRPFKVWDGMTRVPYFFCDYTRCLYQKSRDAIDLLDNEGLKVFGFHPIHIYLNTVELCQYEDTRSLHLQPEKLVTQRSADTRGAREQIIQLLGI